MMSCRSAVNTTSFFSIIENKVDIVTFNMLFALLTVLWHQYIVQSVLCDCAQMRMNVACTFLFELYKPPVE